MDYLNPVEDTTRVAKVITPAGLIIKVQEGDFPKTVRESIRESDPVLAAQQFAKATGLRVTIEERRQITATPDKVEES